MIIGPMPGKEARSIGGATLLMKSIIDELNKKGFEYDFYPLRKFWVRLGQLLDFPFLGFVLLLKGWRYKVISIHASWDFLFTAAPFIICILKLYRVRINIHAFGGHLHKRYKRLPFFYRWWVDKTVFSCNLLNFETKEMVRFFNEEKKKNAVWFPNCRKSYDYKFEDKLYKKKFCFISRITSSKGIYEIVEVFKELGDEYIVDFYGPIDDEQFLNHISTISNIHYKGIITSGKVQAIILLYDILLLPTYYEGEGYPGIIIESYSVGVPVISTKWNSIPEIVEHDYNGLLIAPRSAIQLKRAILSVEDFNYRLLRRNAFESFDHFNIDRVVSDWTNDLRQISFF